MKSKSKTFKKTSGAMKINSTANIQNTHDKTNKEVISKFKDEASSIPMTEFPCVVLVSRS